MEEKNECINTEENIRDAQILDKESYHPRPKWQIVAAWIGMGIVLLAFCLYCYQIATGGK